MHDDRVDLGGGTQTEMESGIAGRLETGVGPHLGGSGSGPLPLIQSRAPNPSRLERVPTVLMRSQWPAYGLVTEQKRGPSSTLTSRSSLPWLKKSAVAAPRAT